MSVNIHFDPEPAMRLTEANKTKIRDRILSGSAALFRSHGYDGVNLDRLMRSAGLTRGAFYAHFKSKQDLFTQVIRHQHPVLRMLQDRPGPEANDLWRQMLEIFDAYLDPGNLPRIYRGCTLASLTGDAARASPEVKRAYEAALAGIVAEMGRGQVQADPARLRAALTLATGAVNTASSCEDAGAQGDILEAARTGLHLLLETAR